MYKKILFCTDGSPAAETAAEYTIWLARQLRAGIRALHITDIRLLEGPLLADLAGAFGAQPYPALLPQLREIQRGKAATILAAAERRCRDRGVSCETAHETGSLVQIMLDQERQVDLVVLGQRGEHARWAGDHIGSTVERLVRASVKPCLVTPEEFREIKRMLIAYDGSAGSAKALAAGIELARALQLEMTVVTVCQSESEDAASKILNIARQRALAAELTARVQLLHGDAEVEILRHAGQISADLIVMGAYGHTRIRELILGSTTSHVLRKATVPVLLVR